MFISFYACILKQRPSIIPTLPTGCSKVTEIKTWAKSYDFGNLILIAVPDAFTAFGIAISISEVRYGCCANDDSNWMHSLPNGTHVLFGEVWIEKDAALKLISGCVGEFPSTFKERQGSHHPFRVQG